MFRALITTLCLGSLAMAIGASRPELPPNDDTPPSAPADSSRRNLLPRARPQHITPDTEKAIQAGLKWLADQQSRDGFWTENVDGTFSGYPITMTSLAGLAMLSSGSTPTQGPFAPQVARSLAYLTSSVDDEGLITRGGSETSYSMYGHGFAMLFLGQVYGMEEDRDRQKRISRILTDAVALTDRAQSTRGGWYYTPRDRFDEGSVTVTQVQGLRSCRNVGIAVSKQLIDHAMKYLDDSALPGGGIAYRVGMTDPRPPITAAAVVCWYNAGESERAVCKEAIKYCIENVQPESNDQKLLGHYYYAHLYMAQAMWLSGDKNWDRYFPRIRDQLLARQRSDGSWDGDNVGRVYGTSIALMILQIPYQYLPICQR